MENGSQQLDYPSERNRLRALLDQMLISDPDLESFCMDYFPKTYQQFSTGMTRLMKINLLISHEEDKIILDKLYAYNRNTSKFDRQLKSKNRSLDNAKFSRKTLNASNKSLIVLVSLLRSNRILAFCLLLPTLSILVVISLSSSKVIHDIHEDLGKLFKKIRTGKSPWYRALLKTNNLQPSNSDDEAQEVIEDENQIEIITDEIKFIAQTKNSSQRTPIHKSVQNIVRRSNYRTEWITYEDNNQQRTDIDQRTSNPSSNYDKSDTDHLDLGAIADMGLLSRDLESDTSEIGVTFSLRLAGCLPLERLKIEPPIMIPLYKGLFTMGSSASEPERSDDETQHEVRITRDFDIMETEVSRFDYDLLKEINDIKDTCYYPAFLNYKKDAMIYVNWTDAILHCNRVSAHEGLEQCYVLEGDSVTWPNGLDCTGYRLPTEAEWEYAARAGSVKRYSGSDNPDDVAWYLKDLNDSSHDGNDHGTLMKSKKANFWNIYDMSGNVSEWVYDYYAPYSMSSSIDPIGPITGTLKIYRGGNLMDSAGALRVASRGKTYHELHDGQQIRVGFRMVRTHVATRRGGR